MLKASGFHPVIVHCVLTAARTVWEVQICPEANHQSLQLKRPLIARGRYCLVQILRLSYGTTVTVIEIPLTGVPKPVTGAGIDSTAVPVATGWNVRAAVFDELPAAI